MQVIDGLEARAAIDPPAPSRRPVDRTAAAVSPGDPPAHDDALAAAVPPADPPAHDDALAADLYAFVSFLQKSCNSDLFEAIGAVELSLTQIKLLHYLEDQPRELTLKEAAELVHVSMPAASRMVDDLVRRGFAMRREDEDDRRMKRVCLNDAGRAVVRTLNAARLNRLERFTSSLTPPQRRSLNDALTRLLERDDVASCRPDNLIS